jgi:hypothetical protein
LRDGWGLSFVMAGLGASPSTTSSGASKGGEDGRHDPRVKPGDMGQP